MYIKAVIREFAGEKLSLRKLPEDVFFFVFLEGWCGISMSCRAKSFLLFKSIDLKLSRAVFKISISPIDFFQSAVRENAPEKALREYAPTDANNV